MRGTDGTSAVDAVTRGRRRVTWPALAAALAVGAGALAGCGGGSPSAQSPATPGAQGATDGSESPQATPSPTTPPDEPCRTPHKYSSFDSRAKKVALTFDDGPSPEITDQVLAVLAEKGVRATFFDIGRSAQQWPEIEKKVVDAGHVVGNHSWSHPQLTKLGEQGVRSQLQRTSDVISKNTGRRVCIYRPPFGATNSSVWSVARDMGMSQALWSNDTRDWAKPGVESIVKNALLIPKGKTAMILMHDGPAGADRSQTIAALPRIIDTLKERGYHFVQADGRPFPGDPEIPEPAPTATATKGASGTAGPNGASTTGAGQPPAYTPSPQPPVPGSTQNG